MEATVSSTAAPAPPTSWVNCATDASAAPSSVIASVKKRCESRPARSRFSMAAANTAWCATRSSTAAAISPTAAPRARASARAATAALRSAVPAATSASRNPALSAARLRRSRSAVSTAAAKRTVSARSSTHATDESNTAAPPRAEVSSLRYRLASERRGRRARQDWASSSPPRRRGAPHGSREASPAGRRKAHGPYHRAVASGEDRAGSLYRRSAFGPRVAARAGSSPAGIPPTWRRGCSTRWSSAPAPTRR